MTDTINDPAAVSELVSLWERLVNSRLTNLPARCYDYNGRITVDRDTIERYALNFGAPQGDADIEVTLASCSQYGGSCLDRANVRVLRDDYGVEAIEDSGAWGESKAWVRLGEVPGADLDGTIYEWTESLRLIVEIIEGLEDYPLISDESHSELESELIDEYWNFWWENDAQSDLEDLFEDDQDGDAYDKADEFMGEHEVELRELYLQYSGDNCGFECETANEVINRLHTKALEVAVKQIQVQDLKV